MNEEEKLLEQEGKNMMTRKNDAMMVGAAKNLIKAFEGAIKNTISKAFEEHKFDKVQRIKGKVKTDVEFPEVQKIKGDVEVKFPETQKVTGDVNAKVIFPKLQKIIGDVTAKVSFPKVQKVEGTVKADVDFPETQKVTTDVPKVKLGNLEVIPVSFFDGKRFITPGGGAGSGASTAGEIRELTVMLGPAKTAGGQVKIVGFTAQQVTSTRETKVVSIQTDDDNQFGVWLFNSQQDTVSGILVTVSGSNAMARLEAGSSREFDLDIKSQPIWLLANAPEQKVYVTILV